MGDYPTAKLEKLRTNNNHSQDGDFKKVKTLGSGAFGCVDLCTLERRKTYAKKGDQVAVKKFFSISDREMAKKEATILIRLKHEFIVAYFDHFKDSKGQLAIVMEFCDKGTLADWVASCVKPIPEYDIWRLVCQFSTALSFLHGQHPPIRHNDLKPANILCRTEPQIPQVGTDGSINIKIADFGLCNVLGKFRLDHGKYLRCSLIKFF